MTAGRLLLLPACLLALSACGDDAAPKTTTAVTPIEQGTTPPNDPSITDPSIPATIEEPVATPGTDTSIDMAATTHSNPAGPVQIDVRLGVDSGPSRVEIVAKGSSVQVNITNPDADDEFHVHGYDLEETVKAGETATFNFTADQAGTFEIESHKTEAVVMVLQVT